MKIRSFLAGIFSLVVLATFAQTMTVNNNSPRNSPYWLAENILVDSNFTIFTPLGPGGLPLNQPNSTQVGTFVVSNNTGTGAFPITSGIVMCANAIADVLPSQSGANPNTTTTDTDLAGVLTAIGSTGSAINDKAEIQFSFVATSDSIAFNYVFGSHEYAGYTCSSYNDVFGFFLEGVGINGNPSTTPSTVNLAVIPGTTIPVAVNTINQGFPSGSWPASNCTNANPNYVAHSAMYIGNSSGSIVSLSGYTQKFTAKAQVVCGNSYNIRLKLANVTDHALSSAVFLEANSFRSPTINISSQLNNGNSFQDTQLVEGCKPSYVIFKKKGNINKKMRIDLVYYGNAINGVDFATLPDSLVMPPGVAEDTLKIYAYDDGLVEPNDSLHIHMQPVTTVCAAYPAQDVVVYFRDKNPVQASAMVTASADTIFCPGDTVRLVGSESGGEGMLFGWWADDTIAPVSRVVQPSQTTTYYYYATDECQSDTIMDSVTIYLANYTYMTTIGDTIKICRGDTTEVNANYLDGNPLHTVTWKDGTVSHSKTVIPNNDSTWYVFTVIDGCAQIAKDSVLVFWAPDPSAGFHYMDDGTIPLRVKFFNNSINAANYLWDMGDGTFYNDTSVSHTYAEQGEYLVTLTIVSPDGCVDSYSTFVKVETDFYLYVPTAFTPDGDGLNETFDVKGTGFETYTIKIFDRWGNQVFYSEDINESWDGTYKGQNAPQGVYTYTIFIQMKLGDISEKKGMMTLYR